MTSKISTTKTPDGQTKNGQRKPLKERLVNSDDPIYSNTSIFSGKLLKNYRSDTKENNEDTGQEETED